MVGYFPELEDQMCEWEPGANMSSPDRMDAMVWALTELSEGSATVNFFASMSKFCPKCQTPSPKSALYCPKCHTSIGESTNDHPLIKSNP